MRADHITHTYAAMVSSAASSSTFIAQAIYGDCITATSIIDDGEFRASLVVMSRDLRSYVFAYLNMTMMACLWSSTPLC